MGEFIKLNGERHGKGVLTESKGKKLAHLIQEFGRIVWWMEFLFSKIKKGKKERIMERW